MEIFAKRLYELRTEKGLTLSAVAKAVGITRQSVKRYEDNHSQPSMEILSKLADLFGVSTDYLYGRTDI
ncbi:MAG: helix-turn-helix transcriptional regulator [Firmicutes bacterium]|nr:helix-turn-helix transcriptional regulator [Bacillota bacterium]